MDAVLFPKHTLRERSRPTINFQPTCGETVHRKSTPAMSLSPDFPLQNYGHFVVESPSVGKGL